MKKTILSIGACALLAGVAATATPAGSPTAKAGSGSNDMESFVWGLISKMTTQEKVGQLNQLSGYGLRQPMTDMVKAGAVGSLLNETDPKVVNALQHLAVDSSRLHIPLIFSRDVIHGYRTMFPIPLGQAATWDAGIVERGARIAAEEATSDGIRWTFSPMLDIARDPRWGRMAEGFGEDPLLTGILGAAMVKGYQGSNLSDPSSMAACVKHFAAYGASESGKDYNTTWIPEPLLRDVYLPPFKDALDAGAATLMCSFNDINGVPSSGNVRLLEGLLRDEWGFDGMVVSDWSSIKEMIDHGYSRDLRHAASQAALAGVDMDMEGRAYSQHLADLVERGEVSQGRLDTLVSNVLKLKYHLGLFDNPYVDEKKASSYYAPASLEAARKCAEEAAILLKNDGTLPLRADGKLKIALVGPMADAAHDQNGTWSFDMDKTQTRTLLKAMRERFGKKNVTYVKGLKNTRDKSTSSFAEAEKAAAGADVVVFACGEEAVLSGEAHCRVDITLPGAQSELLERLKAMGKPVVMVVMAGRPLALTENLPYADAILYNFHPGTMGGPAIAALLAGDACPSGRLPVSMARMSGQTPLYYNHKNTGRPTTEMTLIDDIEDEAGQTSTGCTSFYLDAGDGPLFPFGYGMGYTTFSYTDPRLESAELPMDGTLRVSCDITNTGNREGVETAQLYVRDMVGSLIRPVRELKGFQRVALKPGETRTVTFTLPVEELSFYRADGTTGVEPGDFQLWVSPDSGSGKAVQFVIK